MLSCLRSCIIASLQTKQVCVMRICVADYDNILLEHLQNIAMESTPHVTRSDDEFTFRETGEIAGKFIIIYG